MINLPVWYFCTELRKGIKLEIHLAICLNHCFNAYVWLLIPFIQIKWAFTKSTQYKITYCLVSKQAIAKHYLICLWFNSIETLLTCEDSDLAGYLASLRIIWLCGEVVTTALRDRCMRTLPWIKLLNLYSVSECHDVANADLTNMPFQDEVITFAYFYYLFQEPYK